MRIYGDPDGKDVRSLVLTVCGLQEGCVAEPGGSCFLIAPQIAVTAKHVIEDIFQTYSTRPLQSEGNVVEFSVHVAGQGEYAGIAFESEAITFCPTSDLAILSLRALNQETFDYQHRYDIASEGPFLNFRPPAIGETIWTFGYIGQRLEEGANGVLTAEPLATHGVVRDYFPLQRDSGHINFPSFQTNAEFRGHMSGSPVANEAGEIVGVVSASLHSFEEGHEPVSYAAALWPLLHTRVFISRHGHSYDEETFLFDLYCDRNLIGLNWNHPQFDRRSSAFRSSVPYPTS